MHDGSQPTAVFRAGAGNIVAVAFFGAVGIFGLVVLWEGGTGVGYSGVFAVGGVVATAWMLGRRVEILDDRIVDRTLLRTREMRWENLHVVTMTTIRHKALLVVNVRESFRLILEDEDGRKANVSQAIGDAKRLRQLVLEHARPHVLPKLTRRWDVDGGLRFGRIVLSKKDGLQFRETFAKVKVPVDRIALVEAVNGSLGIFDAMGEPFGTIDLALVPNNVFLHAVLHHAMGRPPPRP